MMQLTYFLFSPVVKRKFIGTVRMATLKRKAEEREMQDANAMKEYIRAHVSPKDSPAVQSVMNAFRKALTDPEYNCSPPDEPLRFHFKGNASGHYKIEINGLPEISLRQISKLYKDYKHIANISVATDLTANNPLVVRIILNSSEAGYATKRIHVPAAKNKCNNILDSARLTPEDLEAAKSVVEAVFNMHAVMPVPEWTLDEGDDEFYLLKATPVESIDMPFYQYIVSKHMGVVHNIVFRTACEDPGRDPSPTLEIYCARNSNFSVAKARKWEEHYMTTQDGLHITQKENGTDTTNANAQNDHDAAAAAASATNDSDYEEESDVQQHPAKKVRK